MSTTVYLGAIEHGESYAFIVEGAYPYYDVVRSASGVAALSDQTTTQISGKYGNLLRRGVFSTATLNEGERYTIVFKNESGTAPASFYTGEILVDYNHWTRAGVILDRQAHLRNDIENVVFPRLKRILGHLGENLMIDNVAVDAAGNMTSMRVRLFEDDEAAEAATEDVDDAVLPEPGEIADYQVTQDWSSPRGIREKHLSVTILDPADVDTTDNQESGATEAPGNETGWPVES